MPQTTDQLTETVRKALHRAYNLGQTYWQQADSESYAANKRSEETAAKFDQLSDETLAALSAVPLVAEAPREPVATLLRGEGGAFRVRPNMDALQAIYALPLSLTAGVSVVPASGPFRDLGAYLARVLDEDQWAHAEALLLKAAHGVGGIDDQTDRAAMTSTTEKE